jgi:hypothetical protein
MVHPFIDANFRDAPLWFNEGLASLFEQPIDVGGHMHGATNWRLPGLQAALRRGTAPSFEDVFHGGRGAFYGEHGGGYYAVARYVCFYLQEKGLLVTFYKRFVRDVGRDPTGYETLRAVLGEPSDRELRRAWEAHVLGLKFVAQRK